MFRRHFIAVLITSLPLTASAGNVGTHCGSKEQIVFNCSVGKKVLSLCMAKPAESKSDYLQYRYGPLARPELIFPKGFEQPANHFFYSNTYYSAGWESRIRVSNETYDYIVYSKTTSGPPEKGGVRKKYPSAGVIILNNKKQIGLLQCVEKDREFNVPDGYLKEEEFDYDPETP